MGKSIKLEHMENLYRPEAQDILLFKEVYALEKVHGTAAGILFNPLTNKISFSSGGESHDKFVSLFDQEQLLKVFVDFGIPNDKTLKIYGEAYGGKQQAMSDTYGKFLKFIAFDVKIGERWCNVPEAEEIAKKLGLEFVPYVKIKTSLEEIDAQRDAMSIVAVRNGISVPKEREGVVLRPLIELTKSNGSRIICKHKGDKFRETASPRVVEDPSKLKVLEDADKIANEWVTVNRLEHILQKLPGHCIEKMRDIISTMTEDVLREGKNEIVESDSVKKALSKKTAEMYKNYLKNNLVTR